MLNYENYCACVSALMTYFSPNVALHPANTMATNAIQKLGAKATPSNPSNIV